MNVIEDGCGVAERWSAECWNNVCYEVTSDCLSTLHNLRAVLRYIYSPTATAQEGIVLGRDFVRLFCKFEFSQIYCSCLLYEPGSIWSRFWCQNSNMQSFDSTLQLPDRIISTVLLMVWGASNHSLQLLISRYKHVILCLYLIVRLFHHSS